MINDIAETGNMLYRKRRIMEKMIEIESLKDTPL